MSGGSAWLQASAAGFANGPAVAEAGVMRTQGVLVRLLVMVAAASPAAAAADTFALPPPAAWHPIGVHVECQSYGRTRACPDLLPGVIGEEPLLIRSEAGSADVIVWVNTVAVGAVDELHLSFTSERPDMTASSELVVETDRYATDDELRDVLRQAVRRGLAPFVAQRFPGSVKVELLAPTGVREAGISAWDYAVMGQGWYTRGYGSQSNAALGLRIRYTTLDELASFTVDGSYTRWDPGAAALAQVTRLLRVNGELRWEHRLAGNLWLGALAGGFLFDNEFGAGERGALHATAAMRLFPIDDVRGNQLTVVYGIGGTVRHDRWDGEEPTLEWHPTHGVAAIAEVRVDRVRLLGSFSVYSSLDELGTKVLDGYQSIDWMVTRRVDVGFSFRESQQYFPGDFGYNGTPPVELSGAFYIRLHWDRDNGVPNASFPPLFQPSI
jgi:hypothetical protein